MLCWSAGMMATFVYNISAGISNVALRNASFTAPGISGVVCDGKAPQGLSLAVDSMMTCR